MDPRMISGMLSNEKRLKVFAAVVLGTGTLENVANMTKLDGKTIIRSLAQLSESGLIEKIGAGYHLCIEALRNAPLYTDNKTTGGSDLNVVGRYIKDGRLTVWPRGREIRLLVLEYIASMFEPDTSYPESEVNEKLSKVHPDFALTRRYLVDEGLLSRASQ